MMRSKLPKRGDPNDKRCALTGQDTQSCVPVTHEYDWCYGCRFYVCVNHSINAALMGSHDVMEHLDPEEDDED